MKKYIVRLSEEERAGLGELVRKGKAAARTLRQGRILLQAAVSSGGPGWQDEEIRTALEVRTGTVQRIRQLFVEAGLEAARTPRPAAQPRPWKLDGVGEAQLIAVACSEPPAGQARGTVRLLAEQLVELA